MRVTSRKKLLLVIFILSAICAGQVNASEIYLIPPGETYSIYRHGVCKAVTNNSSGTIMVPAKYGTEWASFRSNVPAHAEITECPEFGGYWHSGFPDNGFGYDVDDAREDCLEEQTCVAADGTTYDCSINTCDTTNVGYKCGGSQIEIQESYEEGTETDQSIVSSECRNICKSRIGSGAKCCEYYSLTSTQSTPDLCDLYGGGFCSTVTVYEAHCKVTTGLLSEVSTGARPDVFRAMNIYQDHYDGHAIDDLGFPKVLCTYYHSRGLIADLIFRGDNAYAESVHPQIGRAYRAWASPLIGWLKENEGTWADRVVYTMVQAWAQEMAYRTGYAEKGSTLGWWLSEIGEPLHYLAGYFVPERTEENNVEPFDVAKLRRE